MLAESESEENPSDGSLVVGRVLTESESAEEEEEEMGETVTLFVLIVVRGSEKKFVIGLSTRWGSGMRAREK